MKRILLALMLMPFMALATTYYVNGTTGSDSNPGTSPESAKKTIQAAIDVSVADDEILVEPGTYAPITTANKPLSIVGVKGRDQTFIDGDGTSRCAYLGNSTNESATVLSGFTLTNGYLFVAWGGEGGAGVKGGTLMDCRIVDCRINGDWGGYGGDGGGALGTWLDQCEVIGCKALAGGGIIYSVAMNCIIRDCYARDDGGAAYVSILSNCLLVHNYGYNVGGGACGSGTAGGVSYNCTYAYNSAASGGTVNGGIIHNSIFYGNTPYNVEKGWNPYESPCELHSCYTNDPHFVDAVNDNYRLAKDSPCIDKGNNDYVVGDTDLDGNVRIMNGIVDIGCYEFRPARLYVNGTTGSDTNPGTSPSMAKKTIQAAIGVAVDGDDILVAKGVYAPIVVTNKIVTIKSTDGAHNTIIDGNGSMLCANLGAGPMLRGGKIVFDPDTLTTNHVTLIGFTLKNGRGSDAAERGGEMVRCIVTNCHATENVICNCLTSDCLILDNSSNWTTLMHGFMDNCTIIYNDAQYVSWDNRNRNCIIWGNDGDIYCNMEDMKCYYCLSDISLPDGGGNIKGNPSFVDADNGDYRLAAGSPCIDAGNNDYVVGDKDLEGCERIVNGTVDIGCYEFEPDGGPYVETVGDVDWTYMIKNGRASVGDGVSAAITTTTSGAVTIPDRLRTRPVVALDEKALANCNDITEVVIPASVKTIGASAFEGCGKLADVYFEGDTLSSIGLDAFRGCYWDLIMHVYPTWQGRGKTICGYTVMNSASADVKMTVTNVVVHYIQTSELSPMAAPITPDVGIVNVMTEIEGGIVAVPESWATNYPSFKQKFGNDFAVALTRETGKFDANRKPMRVWQDYVAGTDPTDVNDQFRASVTMVEGKPVISYTPVLSETEAAKRVYTIYGKVKLQDETWTPIPEGQEADYNFFKVTVKMK